MGQAIESTNREEDPREKRRHQRVKVSLLGRFMDSGKREFPCQVTNMSPGGVALISPVQPQVGEHIIAYLDHIGRIEGEVVRHVDGGFAMTINATMRKREKLADQLTWLANRSVLGMPEDRRHERFVPKNVQTQITMPDGRTYQCSILDVSLSGAALDIKVRPALGSPVFVGRTRARVVRHFDHGIAVEFSTMMDFDTVYSASF